MGAVLYGTLMAVVGAALIAVAVMTPGDLSWLSFLGGLMFGHGVVAAVMWS